MKKYKLCTSKNMSHILTKSVKYTDKGQVRVIRCLVHGCEFEKADKEFESKKEKDVNFEKKE